MAKELPTQEYLQECFDYNSETNQITWKKRPKSHFATTDITNLFNYKYCGRTAGNKIGQVSIGGVSYAVNRIISQLLNNADLPRWTEERCKLRGVSIDKNRPNNPYRAQITFKGKRYSIGRYATEQEAHAAFCQREKELLSQEELAVLLTGEHDEN
jgi:hypothetical protein